MGRGRQFFGSTFLPSTGSGRRASELGRKLPCTDDTDTLRFI
jgi:hypothetical protein